MIKPNIKTLHKAIRFVFAEKESKETETIKNNANIEKP